jgi:hypothetical protein
MTRAVLIRTANGPGEVEAIGSHVTHVEGGQRVGETR